MLVTPVKQELIFTTFVCKVLKIAIFVPRFNKALLKHVRYN